MQPTTALFSSVTERLTIESAGRLDLLEGADVPLAGGESFAVLVNLLVLVGKAALEFKIGILIIPHVDG